MYLGIKEGKLIETKNKEDGLLEFGNKSNLANLMIYCNDEPKCVDFVSNYLKYIGHSPCDDLPEYYLCYQETNGIIEGVYVSDVEPYDNIIVSSSNRFFIKNIYTDLLKDQSLTRKFIIIASVLRNSLDTQMNMEMSIQIFRNRIESEMVFNLYEEEGRYYIQSSKFYLDDCMPKRVDGSNMNNIDRLFKIYCNRKSPF